MHPVDLRRRSSFRAAFAVLPLLALAACSTTEEEVGAQIEVLAANDIGSARFDAAVEQLVAIGRPGARQLVLLLDPAQYRGDRYREFRDEIERTRTGAAIVLGRIKHKAAQASMEARITTAFRASERRACLRGVGELGYSETSVTALEAQLQDADPGIRLLVAVALVKLGQGSARDTVLNAVRRGDEELAATAIAELEGANYLGVGLLVELLRDGGARHPRLQQALDKVRDQLVRQLANDDPEIRRESAGALGDVDDAAVVAQLQSALEDPSNLVRFNAASSLVRLGNERGTEFLFDALDDADPILRVNAVKSLVRVQVVSRRVEDRLIASLRSDSAGLRSGAAQVLGQAGVASAVDALVAATSDPEAQVRWNAVIALGQIGAQASRPALERRASDADETVAYYAEWALKQLRPGAAI